MEDYEKLGAFYLGRPYHLAEKKAADGIFLYSSKDLVTHAVCVGMTGSGKTGLCIALLEEAAIDGIPAIAIDPKGDLTNLLLTFPDLNPADFLPWVNADDARQKGLSIEDYAANQSAVWKKGLADWGQNGDRIRRLKEAADFAIYTPGSSAGLPVSILKSFAPPPQAILEDEELLRERINTTATSLLGIIGIEADPIKSREHILISVLLGLAWKNQQDIGIAGLIQQIQTPPLNRIGVMDLDTFYPSKERFALALALNNLLAAPGFSTWLEGEPLDINSILYTPAGKPRISIFSIAHLNDAERMFFVSLLLNQVLGWMRTQSGTTSLRSILYMDEIYGYFPPVANPPSKTPLLTLLKQARAYGLGILLATQNPVDLDYKGLANTGTWFIGRLQTERDKARLLDGLEGAAAGHGAQWDRQAVERTLAGLSNRIFLMNNVHEDVPLVFETRWALSYLRGPLTRQQIKQLTDPLKAKTAVAPAALPSPAPSAPFSPAPETPGRGTPSEPNLNLEPQIKPYFIPLRSRPIANYHLFYQPVLIGAATVHFIDSKSNLNLVREILLLAQVTPEPFTVNWETSAEINIKLDDLQSSPVAPALFGNLPAVARQVESYPYWKKDFAAWLLRNQKVVLWASPVLPEYGRIDESERDFRIRLQHHAREESDAAVEQLRQKYNPRFAALQEQIRRGAAAVEREQDQVGKSAKKPEVSFGTNLLGSFLGRTRINAGKTPARGVSRSRVESGKLKRAQDTLQSLQQKMSRLEAGFKTDALALTARYDPPVAPLDQVSIRPTKNNIHVQLLALGWLPLWQNPSGQLKAAWEEDQNPPIA
jgi:hypothetical protein